jgi:hypothetical protein
MSITRKVAGVLVGLVVYAGLSTFGLGVGFVQAATYAIATFNYQADGRAISTEHAGAVEKLAVQYNADGTSTVTTPLGTTQQRTFSTVLGVKKATGIVETCVDCAP